MDNLDRSYTNLTDLNKYFRHFIFAPIILRKNRFLDPTSF